MIIGFPIHQHQIIAPLGLVSSGPSHPMPSLTSLPWQCLVLLVPAKTKTKKLPLDFFWGSDSSTVTSNHSSCPTAKSKQPAVYANSKFVAAGTHHLFSFWRGREKKLLQFPANFEPSGTSEVEEATSCCDLEPAFLQHPASTKLLLCSHALSPFSTPFSTPFPNRFLHGLRLKMYFITRTTNHP